MPGHPGRPRRDRPIARATRRPPSHPATRISDDQNRSVIHGDTCQVAEEVERTLREEVAVGLVLQLTEADVGFHSEMAPCRNESGDSISGVFVSLVVLPNFSKKSARSSTR